jgi:hypothetical protein
LIVLFTAAVCLLPVSWWATKTEGADDAARRYIRMNGAMFGPQSNANATAVLPLIVKVTVEHTSYPRAPWTSNPATTQQVESFYCLWCLGAVVRVPFTTTKDQPTTMAWPPPRM